MRRSSLFGALASLSLLMPAPLFAQTLAATTTTISPEMGSSTTAATSTPPTPLEDRITDDKPAAGVSAGDINSWLHGKPFQPPAFVKVKNMTVMVDDYPYGLRLRVYAPKLPNVDRSNRLKTASLDLTRIRDKHGKSIYDPKEYFESPGHTGIEFEALQNDFMYAYRDITLMKSAKPKDAASIDGSVSISIPVEVGSNTFARTELNAKKPVGTNQVTLVSVRRDQDKDGSFANYESVAFRYAGPHDQITKVMAFNKDGKALDQRGYEVTWIGDKGEAYYDFVGNVQTIKLFFVKKTTTKRVPFHLNIP